MKEVKLFPKTGNFAENKDIAREIRLNDLIPVLDIGEDVTLDFSGVDAATQSFVHALISDLIRKYGNIVLDKLLFKDCNDKIKEIVNIVIDYMQE